MGLENVLRRLATRDAEVAEVVQRFSKTSASLSSASAEGCEGDAEVAEVLNSFTHARARACAHARARGERIDAGAVQTPQPLHVPGPVTLLKHCRCADCLRSKAPVGSSLACPLPSVCLPQREEWHYCAAYHGPQISKDVWAWPRGRLAEVAEVSRGAPGPSDGPAETNRRENGSETCFFRSMPRTPVMEGRQP